MPALSLTDAVVRALGEAGAKAWPKEACGLVFGGMSGSTEGDVAPPLEVVPFPNLQDKLHALDPAVHTRDGRTAYAMDPLAVERRIDAEAEAGRALVAIFHSHPQHPAYFSDTDRRAAMPFAVPTYPDAWQLVVSVYDAKLSDIKGFYWSAEGGEWREGALPGLPPLPGPPPGARPLGDA